MKKFAVIFAVIFLAFAINANADIYEPADPPSGTGSFSCTVWTALTVTPDDADVGLGTFVIDATPYTTFDDDDIAFTIAGEAGENFYFRIYEDEDGAGDGTIATIVVDWTDAVPSALLGDGTQEGPRTLDSGGDYVITATVSSLTAIDSGPETFDQEIEVGYTSF